MAPTFLRLSVLLLLGFSHLLCLNAVPVTRTRNLVHEYHGHVVLEDTQLKNMEKNWEVKTTIGRMNVEVNDYPGSGANNRHTPKRGGGCVEC